VPPATSARPLGGRLLGSLLGAGLALALAFASAHYYSAPTLNAAAPSNSWFEPDFCFAAASGLVALGVALHIGRAFEPARKLDTLLLRGLVRSALTLLLLALWANFVSLLTLLIAPSHAFAALRLVALARAWRAEQLWRK
jgi:hypothetical protein